MGRVLLYYKYVTITHPKRIMDWQKKICRELQLTGRIIIGQEGINGTVGGTKKNTDLYKSIVKKNSLFYDIDFKESEGGAHCFTKLSIKIKNEIVHLGLDPHLVNAKQGGKHLTPQTAHELIKSNPPDLVILDVRNKVEWTVGHFKGAIKPPINYFRELPSYIDEHLKQFENKQTLLYCTGGIRCERASAYLKSKKITKEVYQIKGGIHRYVEQYPNGFFLGKNYVFDNRIVLKITNDILGSCQFCATLSDDYINCLNALCNNHFICCNRCQNKFNNTCNTICRDLVKHNKVKKRIPFKKIELHDNTKSSP